MCAERENGSCGTFRGDARWESSSSSLSADNDGVRASGCTTEDFIRKSALTRGSAGMFRVSRNLRRCANPLYF